MDVEEEPPEQPTRSGIGASRAGLGSGRAGLGMGFASAGKLRDPLEEDSQPPQPTSKGGIGMKKVPTFATAKEPVSEKQVDERDEPRTGIGSTSRSQPPGLRASPLPPSNSGTSTPQQSDLPTGFGSRTQRAFVRNAQPPTPGIAPVQLSYEEKAHFAKISGGFGARMMAKMGWEAVSCYFIQIFKPSLLT